MEKCFSWGASSFNSTIIHKNNGTNDKLYRKVAFLTYTEMLNLGLKAEKPLQNENHTEYWALDNGHVTH